MIHGKRRSTGEELAGGGIRLNIGRRVIGGGDEVCVDGFETTLRGRCGIHDEDEDEEQNDRFRCRLTTCYEWECNNNTMKMEEKEKEIIEES